ncbi:hypothetical protein MKFW12EY_43510 [Methylomonas koyamae]|nr:hypothetical protein MKFW12EY_43510 [Methylomonas koyamae]
MTMNRIKASKDDIGWALPDAPLELSCVLQLEPEWEKLELDELCELWELLEWPPPGRAGKGWETARPASARIKSSFFISRYPAGPAVR